MSLRRSMLAGMAGKKPRRPQFVGIAKVLRLLAGQRHQPGFGFARDRRFPTGTGVIVERSHRGLPPRRARRSVGRSDGATSVPDRPQKTTGLLDRPAIFAPARPGSPARFAIALSISVSLYPHPRAAIQSPAATLP